MKVNDIKALDYQCQGDSLTIPFAETSVEAVLALDAAVLTVKTDAGDMVEVLAGYALKTATVAAADPTSVTDDDTTGGVQAKYICIGGCTFTENGDAYCCGIFAFAK